MQKQQILKSMFGSSLFQCLTNETPASCITLNIMFYFIFKMINNKFFIALILFVISRKEALKNDPKGNLKKMFTHLIELHISSKIGVLVFWHWLSAHVIVNF